MADTPESKVKAQVKSLLKAHKAYQFWPVQTGFGSPTLDCLGTHAGRFFAVETKAPGKKPTVRQQVTADEIRLAGGKVFIIDGPLGLMELAAWLSSAQTN